MKKKILTLLMIMVITTIIFTNTYASNGMFSIGTFETAYKLSNEADIDLPFINLFTKGATYDKDVNHSGISFGSSTIDVDEKLNGVHLIVSTQDMVTIKGDVEHGIIYGTNIVIEGKISGDTILIGDNIKILENAVIEEDIVIVATNLEMSGTIRGSLIGQITTSTIKGVIHRDLRIDAINVDLEEGIVNGNIYISVPADGAKGVVGVEGKYTNAVIKEQETIEHEKMDGEKIINIVLNGVKIVTIYTLVGLFLTRKDKNIASKAAVRFSENTVFGILTGTAMLMLIIAAPILLITLGAIGLGVVAWPILVVYIGLILLSISMSTFVVGMTIYQLLKDKLGKFKIPAIIGIFVLLYALSQITVISYYVQVTINILSMAIIMSYIFKREEKYLDDTIEAKIVSDNKNSKNEK